MREMWESTVKVCLSMCENHSRQLRWVIFLKTNFWANILPSFTATFVNQLTHSSTIGIKCAWEKSAVSWRMVVTPYVGMAPPKNGGYIKSGEPLATVT